MFQGWTLNMEMYFYSIFAVCVAAPRRIGIGLMLGALAGAVGIGLAMRGLRYTEPTTLLAFYTDPLLILFGAGVALRYFEKNLQARVSSAIWVSLGLFAICCAAFIVLRLPYPMPLAWQAAFGLIAVLTVLICVLARNPAGKEGLLAKAGDASYSTYLLHFALIYHVLDHVAPLARSGWLFVGVAVIISNLVGWAAYKLIEHPLAVRLKLVRLSPRLFDRAQKPKTVDAT